MKPYVCLLPILFWHAAAQTSRQGPYRIEIVAGKPHNFDGGPAIAAQLGNIQAVASDRAGNIYLSETDNHRVRRVSAAGVITSSVVQGATSNPALTDRSAYWVDSLFRSDRPTNAADQPAAQAGNAEASRILARGLTPGSELTAADRTRSPNAATLRSSS